MKAPSKQRGGGKAHVAEKAAQDPSSSTHQQAPSMSDDELHLLLRVREVIPKEQLSDERVLTILHDNNNNVMELTSNFFDGECCDAILTMRANPPVRHS